MRFVSHSPRFVVQVVEERAHPTPYGDTIVDREGFHAHFNQDDVTEADLEFALKIWPSMHGQTVLVDEVTPTPVIDRVSVFDTEEEALRGEWEGKTITDNRGNVHDFKTYVEGFLSRRAEDHSDFRQMIEAPLTPPWPNYLEFRGSLEQLVRILVDQGHDLGYVTRYERQLGRAPVVQAIEDEIARQQQELAGAPEVLA